MESGGNEKMDKRQSILIIDDTPMIIRSLNGILKDDYDISVAKSGEQGIETAKKNMPDIILLDLMMPGMSGFDVIEALKSDDLTKGIRIVLITGSDSTDDEERGYALGAVDYIRKPFVDNIVRHRVKVNAEFVEMSRIIKNFTVG